MRVRQCIFGLSGHHSVADVLSYSRSEVPRNITDREVGIFIHVIGLIDIIDRMNGLKKKSHCLSAINRILKV